MEFNSCPLFNIHSIVCPHNGCICIYLHNYYYNRQCGKESKHSKHAIAAC